MSALAEPVLTLDENHVYRLGGAKLPGLTHALRCGGLGEDFFGINEAVLAHAALRGTRVHQAAEIIVQGGELAPDSVWDEIVPYVDAFRLYLAKEDPTPTFIEESIFHTTLRYACTPDFVLPNGSCVEIKATSRIPKFVGYQLAGQGMCLDSMFGSKERTHYVLWLKKDGTYQYKAEKQTPERVRAVAAAVTICREKEAAGLHKK